MEDDIPSLSKLGSVDNPVYIGLGTNGNLTDIGKVIGYLKEKGITEIRLGYGLSPKDTSELVNTGGITVLPPKY